MSRRVDYRDILPSVQHFSGDKCLSLGIVLSVIVIPAFRRPIRICSINMNETFMLCAFEDADKF